MESKTTAELYSKAWVFPVISVRVPNLANVFHFWSILLSGFVEQNKCHFPGRLFLCCILCSSALVVVQCSVHWAAFLTYQPCVLFCSHSSAALFKKIPSLFLFFFPKLSYSRSVLSSSLRRTSVEFHPWKYDRFPLPEASRIEAQFQSLLMVRRYVAEERGGYIIFLVPLPTAAVAFQATKLSFSLSRWFQRLSLGVALCSRACAMQILEWEEEQRSLG